MELGIGQRRGLLAVVALLALLVIVGNIVSSYRWINEPFAGFFLYDNGTVAPDFLPEWSGKKAGLRFLDRIVAVEGREATRRQEIYDLVRSRPLGSPIRYQVDRGGQILSVVIPTIKFTFFDWLLSYGVYLLTGLGFLAIGAAPFTHRTVSPPATALFFMVSAIFFWFATSFDFMTTQILPKELRIFAFALTPGIGIHLGLLLTQGSGAHRESRRLLPFLVYGTSIILGLFYILTFHGPVELWHWSARLAYLYSCLAALIFLALVGSALRHPVSDLERSRLRVMLVGSVLGFFLPTLGTVLASSFRWEIPYNLLLIPTVFFPLSVAFALLKYNLFDIDTVLKLGLSRGALTGALLLIYVLVVSVLSVFVGIYEQGPVVPILFSGLVAMIFNPLLGWIEGLMDRYVYRKEYDQSRLQNDVSLLLRSLSRPHIIAETFLKTVAERIRIEAPLLLFRPQEGEGYLMVSLNGERGLSVDLNSAWIRHFEAHRRGIFRNEAETDPVFQDNRAEFLRVFKELNSELLVPILFEEKLLGLLSLGKKRSGRGYSADDFRLLSTLADQLALSLKNGMLFEESETAKENYRLLYDRSEATNRRLLEMDRLKKQFVANISHEIRTPISAILGYSEVLLDPGFTGDSRAILERVVNGGRDLSHMMDSLLDFSRMEAGSMASHREEVDVRHLFQSLETMAQRLVKGRPIQLRSGIDAGLNVIATDAKRLQQILMHLLTNALKFTERGEIALEFRVHSEGEHEFVEFSVSDTGIGIGQRDQEIVFEEFRQLDGSSTRQYGGTGLGLSLCQKLAQSLGGRIQVESEVGQGSTFSLILPLQRSQRESVLATANSAG
jgi:signal transduction histidine kinase